MSIFRKPAATKAQVVSDIAALGSDIAGLLVRRGYSPERAEALTALIATLSAADIELVLSMIENGYSVENILAALA